MIRDQDADRAAGPRCPTCGEPVTWVGNPARPFCTVRCQLVDLGVWLDERYRLPDRAVSVARGPVEPGAIDVDETDP